MDSLLLRIHTSTYRVFKNGTIEPPSNIFKSSSQLLIKYQFCDVVTRKIIWVGHCVGNKFGAVKLGKIIWNKALCR